MAKKQDIIAALDIGSGKITAVAATIDQQKNIVKISIEKYNLLNMKY